MKGFALNNKGDVLIENKEIQLVHGTELTMQTIKSVLGTQKGEWFLNSDEGIDRNEILGKKRYASQRSALDNQYIQEINEMEIEQATLEQRLAKRLDGEL